MRRPPEAPQWVEFFQELTAGQHADWFGLFHRSDVADLVRRTNDACLHWHKFRYQPMPEGVDRKQAWAAVDLTRSAQRNPLPIAFFDLEDQVHYWSPPQHQAWLHRIDHEAGGMIGGPRDVISGDQDKYLFSSLMEEAIASSQLEGAQTTRKIAKQMLRTKRRPRNKSERMIINNYAAILEIREMLRDKLTPEMLCHLHTILTKDTLDNSAEAGRFRKESDDVRVVDVMTSEILHKPPHAATIGHRIEEICEFANEKSKPFVHPVIKAIVLHFALGFVHPFTDGNGRTARAIFLWYMLKHGYWLFEYLSISRIVLQSPGQYGRAYLYTETDHGDVTYFVHYHLRVINRAIRELHSYLLRQQRKLKEALTLVEACPGINHRQSWLLHDALKHPDKPYTIQQHGGTHHVAYATARADLIDLEARGFFRKRKQGRKLVFYPVDDLVRRLEKPKRTDMQLKDHAKRREDSF